VLERAQEIQAVVRQCKMPIEPRHQLSVQYNGFKKDEEIRTFVRYILPLCDFESPKDTKEPHKKKIVRKRLSQQNECPSIRSERLSETKPPRNRESQLKALRSKEEKKEIQRSDSQFAILAAMRLKEKMVQSPSERVHSPA
jgi:hypothetical protein